MVGSIFHAPATYIMHYTKTRLLFKTLRYFPIIDLYTEKKSQAGRNVTLPPAAAGGDVAPGGNVTL